MQNVYIEPLPKARPEGTAIDGYILEFAGDIKVSGIVHRKQEDAINEAKKGGHKPLVARVRNTNKGNPDHWRSAN